MIARLFVLASVAPVAAALAAEAPAQEAEFWEATQAPSAAGKSAAGPFSGLGARLTDALFQPRAAAGALAGTDANALSSEARITYQADPAAFDAALAPIGKELAGKLTLCVSGGELSRSVKVSRTGLELFAASLGVPRDATEVTPVLDVTIGDRIVRATDSSAGGALVEALRKRGSQTRPTVAELWPPLEEVPVRLTLTTTDQKKITLAAELDGDATKYKLADGAAWLLPGGARVPVDTARPLQRIMLDRVLREGAAKLERVSIGAIHPSWSGPVVRATPRRLELHVIGAEERWFGSVAAEPGATLVAQREVEGCDLKVRLEPTLAKVDLPPLPLSAWKKVTGLLVVNPAEKEVALGFLDRPATDKHEGALAPAAFDALLSRPQGCATLCGGKAKSLVEARYQRLLNGYQALPPALQRALPRPEKPTFDTDACARACTVRKGYFDCLDAASDGEAVDQCNARLPSP